MAGVLDTIGSVLGTSNRDQINAGKDTLYGIQQKADETTAANKALMGQYLKQMQDTYGANSARYNEALENVANAIGDYKDFSYTKALYWTSKDNSGSIVIKAGQQTFTLPENAFCEMTIYTEPAER